MISFLHFSSVKNEAGGRGGKKKTGKIHLKNHIEIGLQLPLLETNFDTRS